MSLRLDGSLWTLNTTIPREPYLLESKESKTIEFFLTNITIGTNLTSF